MMLHDPVEERLRAMVKRCRTRGGDCPCVGKCKAIEAIDAKKSLLEINTRNTLDALDRLKVKAETPPATLVEGFEFKPGLTPVIYFDGDGAEFGYEDDDGEYEPEEGVWPFNESHVFPCDVEKLGFTVA